MDPFLLAPGEQIVKASLAYVNFEKLPAYLTNNRLVILNKNRNIILNSFLKDVVNINMVHSSMFKDSDLKVFFKNGTVVQLLLLNEGNMKKNEAEMNSWFNYIDQYMKLNG